MINQPSRKTLLLIGTTLFIIAMMAAILAPPGDRDRDESPRPAPSGETRTDDSR